MKYLSHMRVDIFINSQLINYEATAKLQILLIKKKVSNMRYEDFLI